MLYSMSATTFTTVEGLVRAMDENPELLEAMRARLLTRELLEMPATLAEFMAVTKRQFEAIDRRLQRIGDDLTPIKAAHARHAAMAEADLIAVESGLDYVRVLPYEDIKELARNSDTAGISTDELRSFRRADLILEAKDRAGQRCFLAAEVSYTVDDRDTTRALRNAALLTRFTGQPAYAAVAGLRFDRRIRNCIGTGEVAWYQLDARSLEVD